MEVNTFYPFFNLPDDLKAAVLNHAGFNSGIPTVCKDFRLLMSRVFARQLNDLLRFSKGYEVKEGEFPTLAHRISKRWSSDLESKLNDKLIMTFPHYKWALELASPFLEGIKPAPGQLPMILSQVQPPSLERAECIKILKRLNLFMDVSKEEAEAIVKSFPNTNAAIIRKSLEPKLLTVTTWIQEGEQSSVTNFRLIGPKTIAEIYRMAFEEKRFGNDSNKIYQPHRISVLDLQTRTTLEAVKADFAKKFLSHYACVWTQPSPKFDPIYTGASRDQVQSVLQENEYCLRVSELKGEEIFVLSTKINHTFEHSIIKVIDLWGRISCGRADYDSLQSLVAALREKGLSCITRATFVDRLPK